MKDPICNMDVSAETAAAREQYQGETYYFCSPSCAEQFRAHPMRWAASSATAAVAPKPESTDRKLSGQEYACPNRPEIRHEEAGDCPECGLEMEPVAPLPPPGTGYACPMHPEIALIGRGFCRICGRPLERRKAPAPAAAAVAAMEESKTERPPKKPGLFGRLFGS